MAFTGIEWEMQAFTRETDQLTGLVFVDEINLEANTNGVSFTPVVVFESGDVTLTAISTSTRQWTTRTVNRMGLLVGARLEGSFESPSQPRMYAYEMVVRPLFMGVRINGPGRGQRFRVDGRTIDSSTSITFDVDPENRLFDAQAFVPLIQRLYLDIDTGGANVTPTILLEGGNSIALAAQSTASRATVVIDEIQRLGKVIGLTLTGDFSAELAVYGVELHMRPLPLNLAVLSEEATRIATPLTGRLDATTANWDVIPETRELDELRNLHYFERVTVEANTNSQNLQVRITQDGSAITSTAQTSSARDYLEFTFNRFGPIQGVDLIGSFFDQNIQVYNVDCHVRPVVLSVNIVSSGTVRPLPGRTVDPTTAILFDLTPFTLSQDARFLRLVMRRLYIDIETGAQTVTPVLRYNDGTSTTLAAITQAGRAIVEFNILRTSRLERVELQGDFTNSAVILYDISIDVYVPANRRLAVG